MKTYDYYESTATGVPARRARAQPEAAIGSASHRTPHLRLGGVSEHAGDVVPPRVTRVG